MEIMVKTHEIVQFFDYFLIKKVTFQLKAEDSDS